MSAPGRKERVDARAAKHERTSQQMSLVPLQKPEPGDAVPPCPLILQPFPTSQHMDAGQRTVLSAEQSCGRGTWERGGNENHLVCLDGPENVQRFAIALYF